MRIVSACLAALALVALPAAAQTYTANTALADVNRLIKNVTVEDMKAIVVAEGHTIDSVDTAAEAPMVVAQTPGGLFYVLKGQACELEGYENCLGLSIEVRYDADPSVSYETINEANASYLAGKVYRGLNEDGVDTVFVTNYAILDSGQTMGNLRTIVANMIEIGPAVSGIIWPAE
jgi:hypothetical protein